MAGEPTTEHRCDSDGIEVDGEWWFCNQGSLYGPCEYFSCGGRCEYKGDCECDCHEPAVPSSKEPTDA